MWKRIVKICIMSGAILIGGMVILLSAIAGVDYIGGFTGLLIGAFIGTFLATWFLFLIFMIYRGYEDQ